MLQSEPEISRRELSRRVCDWLNWRSPNGNLKDMSCRKALMELSRQGIIEFPRPPRSGLFIPKARPRPPDLCPQIHEITGSLEELGDVEIIPVDAKNRSASRTWNALMDRYHFLGHGPLCGAQMRYLIRSSVHRWIGGLAFSAAAWRVHARDEWIGWSDQARRQNLSKVLCNSRFLLIPRIPNLASHVLGMCTRRIPQDWQSRYAVEPLLIETYVERGAYQGTCYRAANWLHVGTTRGRGRMDRDHANTVPTKEVYVFPLQDEARRLLCTAPDPVEPSPARDNAAPEQVWMESGNWAHDEFGKADFADSRLTKRLVTLAEDLYARPQAHIAQACQSRAKTKAAYRFFAHRDTSMEKILEPHYETTLHRIRKNPVVLAVSDTTSLDYSTHPATERLGPIAGFAEGPIGLIVHDTMAFNPEGTPLGLLDVQCWARQPDTFGKRKRRATLPIEQKESSKWLKSFRQVALAQKKCPDTQLVSVGDREADLYDLFELALADPSGPKLLVRAQQKRPLADEEGYIWEKVSGQEISSYLTVRVPCQGARAPREAILAIRFAEVKLKPPCLKRTSRPLTVWAVLAQETHAPGDIAPIEWRLITTCRVNTPELAVEQVKRYSGRWGIEVYHRTLKSGCKIEQRQLGSADRIEACLAIDMVVAWRIHHLTKLGRETPDVPCTVFFEDHEWKALVAYWNHDPAPKEPPTLRQAVRMTAQLGGFLGRKGDGEPGTKTMWLGLQRLDDLAAMYRFMNQFVVPHPHDSTVSSNPGYG